MECDQSERYKLMMVLINYLLYLGFKIRFIQKFVSKIGCRC